MHGYLKQSASSLGCIAFQLLLSVLIVGIRQVDFQELVAKYLLSCGRAWKGACMSSQVSSQVA